MNKSDGSDDESWIDGVPAAQRLTTVRVRTVVLMLAVVMLVTGGHRAGFASGFRAGWARRRWPDELQNERRFLPAATSHVVAQGEVPAEGRDANRGVPFASMRGGQRGPRIVGSLAVWGDVGRRQT